MVQRVGGLISGLDTDALVKALTLGQQSKIDKLKQANTKGTWQQNEYRTIVDKLNDFKAKYFSQTNPLTNLSSAATITQYSSNVTKSNGSTSAAVTATATGAIKNTSHSIEVHSLAQKETWSGASPTAMTGSKAADLSEINRVIGEKGSFEFSANVDGQMKTITLSASDNIATGQDLATTIQSKINSSFGSGKVAVDLKNGALNFAASGGHTFGIGDSANGVGNISHFGFDKVTYTSLQTNAKIDTQNFATPLAGTGDNGKNFSFNINGKEFSFDSSQMSMQDVFNKVNDSDAGVRMYYSEVSNAVVMESKNAGVANKVEWSDNGGNFMNSIFKASDSGAATTRTQVAKDADITIDGQRTTRSSNNFALEGINYQLNTVTDEAVNVNMVQDVSKAKTMIMDFVKDYNQLMSYINGKTREESTGFSPLTDEQKTTLSEYEMKDWEEQAKKGLLKNDPMLRNVLSGLSNSVFMSKGGGAMSYSLGMMQSGTYSDGGQIKLDAEQLEKALRDNPSAVEEFFTGAEGLAKNMTSVINTVASTEILSQGTLVKKAGYAGKSSEYFNDISAAARDRSAQVELLLEAMTKKQNDLYARYAKMESVMNTMQQQMSSLSKLG